MPYIIFLMKSFCSNVSLNDLFDPSCRYTPILTHSSTSLCNFFTYLSIFKWGFRGFHGHYSCAMISIAGGVSYCATPILYWILFYGIYSSFLSSFSISLLYLAGTTTSCSREIRRIFIVRIESVYVKWTTLWTNI